MENKKIVIVIAFTALLVLTNISYSYEPIEELTTTKISELSDAFVFCSIKNKIYSKKGRLITINKAQVIDVYFDRTESVKVGDKIDIMTRVGEFTNPEGKKVKVRELNAPELINKKTYMIYLRWDSSVSAFIPTTGESSVYEVDDEGSVLNIHGYYILDVKDGKLSVGKRKKQRLSDEKAKEIPPPAIIEDIYGNKTEVYPQMPDVKYQQMDKKNALKHQEFLEKVKKPKK